MQAAFLLLLKRHNMHAQGISRICPRIHGVSREEYSHLDSPDVRTIAASNLKVTGGQRMIMQ